MYKYFLISMFATGAAVATGSNANAETARVLYQSTNSVIVRMSANTHDIVWQEVGDKKADKTLYSINLATGKRTEIESAKRPFGPSVAGDYLIYGAGRLHESIEVVIRDLRTGKSRTLHKQIPWVVEPSLQLVSNGTKSPTIQAVWERSADDDGNGLAIYLWEGDNFASEKFRVLAEGPMLRKNEIPKEYHRSIHNEYPEIDGGFVAFQNNEYGTPNIYRMNIATQAVERLSPSPLHQERPAISGPYTAWEESERSFAVSNESSVFVHDARTGEVKQLNPAKGFHYQIRLFGKYAVYGAKRAPMPSTPSVRIYDLEKNVELDAHKCFTGPIFDYVPTVQGVYAAQKVSGTSSRLLFATWEQLEKACH